MESGISRDIEAAIAYLERKGFGNVTLVDEGGNVLIATLGDGAGRETVACVVDGYGEGEEQWDEDAYRESIADLASGGLRFDRGDVITLTHLEGDRALLRHRPGLWPGEE